MKMIISLMLGLFLMGFITGCEEEIKNTNDQQFSGKMIHHSPCKSGLKSASLQADTPDSLSCVDYLFDKPNNKLTLKHINAAFNCCPDSLYCQVSLKGDTIYIREMEARVECKCDCLYDLDIEIRGVEAKKYRIVLDEPYVGNMKPLEFIADLSKESSGSYCVARKQYPWAIETDH